MVPRTLLQTRCYAPAAGSVLTSFEGLLHPVKRFEGLLHPVPACIGQMRSIVTPGQASATSRQSRSLDTLATTDNDQVASMLAARHFDQMPQPKKWVKANDLRITIIIKIIIVIMIRIKIVYFIVNIILSKLPILGHLPMLLNKKNSLRMGEFHAELKVSSSLWFSLSSSHLGKCEHSISYFRGSLVQFIEWKPLQRQWWNLVPSSPP